MASPFPGIDPYLENPELWSSFHSRLIVAIADAIAPAIRPKYYTEVEKRVYLSEAEESVLVGIPDVTVFSKSSVSKPPTLTPSQTETKAMTVMVPFIEEVTEKYLEVREVKTGKVITTIEVLSPKNKRSGTGRDAYENKRKKILASFTHLVEIDLLRAGTPMAILGSEQLSDYRILISRSECRPTASLYAFSLQEQIPSFPLPLASGDTEPLVDLQSIINGLYERAAYDLRIDYTQPVPQPLSPENADWIYQLLKEKGLRQ